MSKCSTCRRELNNPLDALSENCGGDCGYCMLSTEISIGDYITAIQIAFNIIAALNKLNAGATITWNSK